ncbi:MAG: HlyD family type I secretion periplasmic adaptor subunit [Gammaproteobacteria bacterium]|nr:HlyD family type I secretion periplasmic adaptor subunit [Gammaproteobacteria bacterium]
MPARYQATKDLLKRYAAVFAWSWRDRKRHDGRARLPHEAQFLPAALALQEMPVSPLPRVAMWLLMAFALIALLWAVFGRIDIVATAQGKIVPNDRTKVIQPIETATVKAIHVVDGQGVKAGEVLIELDATSAQADKDRLASDLAAARLQLGRARALLAALANGRPPRLEKGGGGISGVQWQEAQHLLEGQYGEYTAKRGRIEADIARREAERRSILELVRKLEQTAPIARQRAQDYKDLVDKSFVPRHGYLEREQERIEQEGDLATQRSRLQEIDAALVEGQSQRTALIAETRRLTLDSLNEGLQKAQALEQELLKADTRGRLMTLVSPVDGTVQQLAVHTVGGVVTPAQPVMVIVPGDHPLEVEAFVENKDIGFVNAGQSAEVKIETFPYTKYGTIHAKLTHLSHDAINDEKRGLIYSSRVKMEKATLAVEGKQVNLTPGMAVTVEIKTGKRRVIEYFLSPLLQYGQESLRER